MSILVNRKETKMPWKEETIMSLKEEFIRQAVKGEQSFALLCETYKISRTAGYRLLNRYKKEGLAAFNPRSKAPKHSPHRTLREIQERILTVRAQHPTWGARKIKAYLNRKGIHDLPAPSTITEILRRHGCLSEEESLKRKALIRFEREACNDLWQMDFKGRFKLQNRESCHPLTILDDCSRFSIGLRACRNEQYQTVKEELREIFECYGLPWQINVDNGNPWGNPGQHPYTQLTVWFCG
jgi:transposase